MSNITFSFVFGFLAAMISYIYYTEAMFDSESAKFESLQQEAVSRGFAEWVVNPENPRTTEFKWK